MSILARAWYWLAGDSSFSVVGPEAVRQLADERASAILATETHPTFADAWGCLDCDVIQRRPANHRCGFCGRENVVSLTLQLQRGSTRIQRNARREVMRQVK